MHRGARDAKAIFDRAVEIESAEGRDGFVVRECAGDAGLLERVRGLLGAYEAAGSFLESPPAGLRSADTKDRPPGERLGEYVGPYRLLQQIGEGGMGVVYMAEQASPVRRMVALKVIKAGMDSREVLSRFEAERQALASMDHPNIARVLDADATESGRPYFVMDLVKGVPITQYCDERRLSPRERLELFLPVCQAVQHAHQKGIIHRDLKPSNVLVALYDDTPVPKVIDFGVAKAAGPRLTEATLFTEFGAVVGTLEYMSPEQAGLNQLDVDTRSDVYSLGVLLYELLTGTTPLDRRRLKEATLLELLRLVREDESPRPSTRLSTAEGLPLIAERRQTEPRKLSALVRGELDWVVMKALEKDRARRYETASGLASDVRRYLDDEPVQAFPPSAWYRARKLVRRHRGPVVAACLLVLALVGGIVGTTWGLFRASDARARAVWEAGQKQVALTAARGSERDAQDRLFLALWNQARAGRYSRQIGQRLDSLEALTKAARIRPDERLRDEAIAALALPDVRRHGTSWDVPPDGTSRSIAFDGLYRVYARDDRRGVISVRQVSDDREVGRILVEPGTTGHARLSPDGRFLARLEGKLRVRVWSVADGEPILREASDWELGWDFSPDSRHLAIGQDGCVLRFDLMTGREVNRWRLPARAKASQLAFHPDGRRLAVGCPEANLAAVFDATDGTLLAELPTSSGGAIAWHPDGLRLAVAGLGSPHIRIWDVAARRELATIEGHSVRVWSLSFHPDGDLLASTSEEGTVHLWDPSSGRRLMQLPSSIQAQFSGDGRWLGAEFHGEQVRLLEAVPSREYRTLVSDLGAGRGGFHQADISPDGGLLAVGMDDATRFWDLRSGRQVASLPGRTGNVFFDRSDTRWELLTDGPNGLLRWPAQGDDPASQGSAPPTTILPAHREFALGPGGHALGAVYEPAAPIQLMDLHRDVVRQELGVHENGGGPHAVSPDGRWVASCGWHSHSVRVWDARSGRLAHEWDLGQTARVFFTPDSRALIISRSQEFSFWDVETWQPIRRLPCETVGYSRHVAFSPDGRLMALEMAPADIHLKGVATGRTVARLEDPHRDQTTWIGFTPDGTRLVTSATYARAIHVWDLRAIRERLKPLGLDWDWDEFPPAAPASHAAGPLRVDVIPGDLASPELTLEQRARQAIDRCRRVLEADPDDVSACNDLAWAYLTAPGALRDVEAALPLAEKAARLAPKNAVYGNTLGMAYYRAGRHREAVGVLRPNLEEQEDWALAFDLYVLAMCHHHLGEPGRARDYYDWAVRWPRAHRKLSAGHLAELDMFRAEAAELLEVDAKQD